MKTIEGRIITAAVLAIIALAWLDGYHRGRGRRDVVYYTDTVRVVDTVVKVRPETLVFWRTVQDTVKVRDTVILSDTVHLGDIPVMQILKTAENGRCLALADVLYRGQVYRLKLDAVDKGGFSPLWAGLFGFAAGVLVWEALR